MSADRAKIKENICAAAVCARAQRGKPPGEYHTVTRARFLNDIVLAHPDKGGNDEKLLACANKRNEIFPPRFEDNLLYCKGRRPIGFTEASRRKAETKLREQKAKKKQAAAAEQAAAEQSIKRRVKKRIFAEKETERQSNGDSNPENCFNALCERMGDENITNGYFQKNRSKVDECRLVGALGKFAELKCPAARLADDFFDLLLLDVKQ